MGYGKREATKTGYGKREAEPIEAGYGLPKALPLTLPVPIVHNAPAPILNHFVQPVPVAPTPIAQIPAPLPVASAPVPLPFAQVPAPLASAPAPAPLSVAPAPVPVAIPSTPSSQFHAQDEFGQFSFG